MQLRNAKFSFRTMSTCSSSSNHPQEYQVGGWRPQIQFNPNVIRMPPGAGGWGYPQIQYNPNIRFLPPRQPTFPDFSQLPNNLFPGPQPPNYDLNSPAGEPPISNWRVPEPYPPGTLTIFRREFNTPYKAAVGQELLNQGAPSKTLKKRPGTLEVNTFDPEN